MPSSFAPCRRCRQPHDTGYLRCESCRLQIAWMVKASRARKRRGETRPRTCKGLDLIVTARGPALEDKERRIADMIERAQRGEPLA